MTHASVPPEQREKLEIGDNFIRLSCGIEEADDLINDLDQAINAAVSSHLAANINHFIKFFFFHPIHPN